MNKSKSKGGKWDSLLNRPMTKCPSAVHIVQSWVWQHQKAKQTKRCIKQRKTKARKVSQIVSCSR